MYPVLPTLHFRYAFVCNLYFRFNPHLPRLASDNIPHAFDNKSYPSYHFHPLIKIVIIIKQNSKPTSSLRQPPSCLNTTTAPFPLSLPHLSLSPYPPVTLVLSTPTSQQQCPLSNVDRVSVKVITGTSSTNGKILSIIDVVNDT